VLVVLVVVVLVVLVVSVVAVVSVLVVGSVVVGGGESARAAAAAPLPNRTIVASVAISFWRAIDGIIGARPICFCASDRADGDRTAAPTHTPEQSTVLRIPCARSRVGRTPTFREEVTVPRASGGRRRCSCQARRRTSRSMSDAQPSGTVTLVFTDVEGSTKLLDELGTSDRAGSRRAL